MCVTVAVQVRGADSVVQGPFDLGGELTHHAPDEPGAKRRRRDHADGGAVHHAALPRQFAPRLRERRTLRNVQVYPDAKLRRLAQSRDRGGGGGHVRNKRRGRDDPVAMRAKDALRDSGGEAEVVGVDDRVFFR